MLFHNCGLDGHRIVEGRSTPAVRPWLHPWCRGHGRLLFVTKNPRPLGHKVFDLTFFSGAAQGTGLQPLELLPQVTDLEDPWYGGIVSSNVVFVGPVVQSARFHDFRFASNRSKSFWRYRRDCQFLISWPAQHCERFACRCNVILRDGRSTFELCVQISWQARHFRAFVAGFQLARRFRGRRSTLRGRGSRCGAARIWRLQSEPCGVWVGRIALAVARCTAKRTLCALWVGRIALAVARHTF